MNDVTVVLACSPEEARYLLTQADASLTSMALKKTYDMTADQKTVLRLKYDAVEKLARSLQRTLEAYDPMEFKRS